MWEEGPYQNQDESEMSPCHSIHKDLGLNFSTVIVSLLQRSMLVISITGWSLFQLHQGNIINPETRPRWCTWLPKQWSMVTKSARSKVFTLISSLVLQAPFYYSHVTNKLCTVKLLSSRCDKYLETVNKERTENIFQSYKKVPRHCSSPVNVVTSSQGQQRHPFTLRLNYFLHTHKSYIPNEENKHAGVQFL